MDNPLRDQAAVSLAPVADVSVVVYVDEHLESAAEMHASVAGLLKDLGKSSEFIFVDDGNSGSVASAIQNLRGTVKNARVVRLPRFYGTSVAMSIGFRQAQGDLVLTLGSFLQVEPAEIRKMFAKIEQGFDFVNGWRVNRKDTVLNQLHTKIFNSIVRKAAKVELHDTNCTLKLFKKKVVEELPIYGDFYRFLPVLAIQQGFKVTEVEVNQRKEINRYGVYPFGIYVRRALDLLALLFIGRFIRKPLRFFGLIGSAMFITGLLTNLYLSYAKLALHVSLSDRPLLILATLLMVLGVQTASVGLIGELILFTHAKQMQDYQIEQIVQ